METGFWCWTMPSFSHCTHCNPLKYTTPLLADKAIQLIYQIFLQQIILFWLQGKVRGFLSHYALQSQDLARNKVYFSHCSTADLYCVFQWRCIHFVSSLLHAWRDEGGRCWTCWCYFSSLFLLVVSNKLHKLLCSGGLNCILFHPTGPCPSYFDVGPRFHQFPLNVLRLCSSYFPLKFFW